MNKSKISNAIIEMESKIDEMDAALDSANNRAANMTLLLVFSLINGLRNIAKEETVLTNTDQQKLLGCLDTAVRVITLIRIGVDNGDYRYALIASSLLQYVIDDIRELVNEEKSKNRIEPDLFFF